MPHAEGLTRLTAPLKLNHQPLRLNPAPATAHCNPSRFTHAISPSQHRYPEKVWLLPRVPSRRLLTFIRSCCGPTNVDAPIWSAPISLIRRFRNFIAWSGSVVPVLSLYSSPRR